MNLKELHTEEKAVSATSLFKNEHANNMAIQILEGEQLKEHSTKVPALLICVEGEVIFENEEGAKETMLPGDYVNIEAMVKHWVSGVTKSQLVLLR